MRLRDELVTVLAGPEMRWTGTLPPVVPTFSAAEMLSNPGLEPPYVGGLANGWSLINTPTPAEETTIVHTPGGSSQKITSATSGHGLHCSPTMTLGKWYQGSVWLYVASGVAAYMRSNAPVWDSPARDNYSTAAWAAFVITGLCILAGTSGPYVKQSTAAATVFYVDDASLRPLTLSTLYQLHRTAFVNGTFAVPVTRLAGSQTGIIHYADAANMVIVTETGDSGVRIRKCVAGTWSSVMARQAVVYGAGKTLSVQRSGGAGAGLYTVLYDGAPVSVPQSITDVVFDYAKWWGVFSTLGTTFAGAAANSFGTCTWIAAPP